MFRIGVVQNFPQILKVGENLKKCLELMKRQKADLWVLPEFFATGYNFKNRREVERVGEKIPDGVTAKTLLEFSHKNRCAIAAGLVEKKAGRYFNSAILVGPGKFRIYRKTHLFGKEKSFFARGDTGFWVEKVAGVKIGVMICFDWFFPESARTLALLGAEVIAHPANLVLPWGPEGMKIRSLENRVFTATANRVGTERGLKFIGQSQIVSPRGEILFRAKSDRVQIFASTVNPKLARNKKVTAQNDLFPDRRVDIYRLQKKVR